MRESLGKASQQEERERFRNAGLAEISNVLRGDGVDDQSLSASVITKLVQYFRANQGDFSCWKGRKTTIRTWFCAGVTPTNAVNICRSGWSPAKVCWDR